jgi:hypothetical protein
LSLETYGQVASLTDASLVLASPREVGWEKEDHGTRQVTGFYSKKGQMSRKQYMKIIQNLFFRS